MIKYEYIENINKMENGKIKIGIFFNVAHFECSCISIQI